MCAAAILEKRGASVARHTRSRDGGAAISHGMAGASLKSRPLGDQAGPLRGAAARGTRAPSPSESIASSAPPASPEFSRKSGLASGSKPVAGVRRMRASTAPRAQAAQGSPIHCCARSDRSERHHHRQGQRRNAQARQRRFRRAPDLDCRCDARRSESGATRMVSSVGFLVAIRFWDVYRAVWIAGTSPAELKPAW
jgi:hypothetical protein